MKEVCVQTHELTFTEKLNSERWIIPQVYAQSSFDATVAEMLIVASKERIIPKEPRSSK